jgi:glycine dehydrogenase subunit 2
MSELLIGERSKPGLRGAILPRTDFGAPPLEELLPQEARRKTPLNLPEVSEPAAVRHYTRLSQLNYAIDTTFVPLGSCTMKYNPKVNEDAARLSGFAEAHPLWPAEACQGLLRLLYELERELSALTGVTRFTLAPRAGAHGELLGMMLVRACFEARGETRRRMILVPDSAHGTNPASAARHGFEVVSLKSDIDGQVDPDSLRAALNDRVACLMLTNPNTLGVFDRRALEIADLVHDAGGLLYYDGANLNAICGIARPGDMGFDIVHLNLHKTFSTPHGGGGPGAGPVGVVRELEPLLPVPLLVRREDGSYALDEDRPQSIGRIGAFLGNVGMLIRAHAYIRQRGLGGLQGASSDAVLAANYLLARLEGRYARASGRRAMHEFVLSASEQAKLGVHATDIAKRLLDKGFYAPTIYFPLTVPEALMIEPTETESLRTLDAFAQALLEIADEAENQPEFVTSAPHTTPVRRLDDVRAARRPIVRYTPSAD